ncbi:MAG: outer membrane beta-barrel protein [Candidatus Kapaibacterium sp.]
MHRGNRFGLVWILSLVAAFMLPNLLTAQSDEGPLHIHRSRSQWLIGLSISFLHNYYHEADITGNSTRSIELNSSSLGYGFGVSAELLPNVYTRWGIIPRFSYEHRPAKMSTTVDGIRYDYETGYNLLNVEVLYKYEVGLIDGARVGVSVGPAFQYALLDSVDRSEFDNQEAFDFFAAAMTNITSTRLSARGGIQVEFGVLDNHWMLVPGLYYDFPLTSIGAEEFNVWKVNSIILQIDFRRAIGL